jgi:hypothetical protein
VATKDSDSDDLWDAIYLLLPLERPRDHGGPPHVSSLLASIAARTVVLPRAQSTSPALAAVTRFEHTGDNSPTSPALVSTGIFHEEGASTPPVALMLNITKVEYTV